MGLMAKSRIACCSGARPLTHPPPPLLPLGPPPLPSFPPPAPPPLPPLPVPRPLPLHPATLHLLFAILAFALNQSRLSGRSALKLAALAARRPDLHPRPLLARFSAASLSWGVQTRVSGHSHGAAAKHFDSLRCESPIPACIPPRSLPAGRFCQKGCGEGGRHVHLSAISLRLLPPGAMTAIAAHEGRNTLQ